MNFFRQIVNGTGARSGARARSLSEKSQNAQADVLDCVLTGCLYLGRLDRTLHINFHSAYDELNLFALFVEFFRL